MPVAMGAAMRCLAISLLALIWSIPANAAETSHPSDEGQGVSPQRYREDSAKRYEISLLGAYGAGGKYEDSPVNRYGAGLGVRAGLTFGRLPVYAGVRITKFFGGSDASGEYYTNTLDAELGYSIYLHRDVLWVRPQIGLGLAQTVSIQSDNSGYPLAFHIAPAVVAGLQLTPLLLTVGVQQDVIAGDWANATTLSLGAGVSF